MLLWLNLLVLWVQQPLPQQEEEDQKGEGGEEGGAIQRCTTAPWGSLPSWRSRRMRRRLLAGRPLLLWRTLRPSLPPTRHPAGTPASACAMRWRRPTRQTIMRVRTRALGRPDHLRPPPLPPP
eukprot:jgi/Mesen1/10656/ME000009S10449